MAFIIGAIGSGICVRSVTWKTSSARAGRREGIARTFFAPMFVFLAAMFLIVFSNNMLWLFTGWGITTACSFLIGFTSRECHQERLPDYEPAGRHAFPALCVMAISSTRCRSSSSCRSASPTLAWSCCGHGARVRRPHQAAQMPFHTWPRRHGGA
ncbi:MAG: hypothetical protein ACLSVD_17050 [Eggerthellaceae bacterium]